MSYYMLVSFVSMVPPRAQRSYRPGPAGAWLPVFSAGERRAWEVADPEGFAVYQAACDDWWVWWWGCNVAGWALVWLVPSPGEVVSATPATAGPPPPEVLDVITDRQPLGPPCAPLPRSTNRARAA